MNIFILWKHVSQIFTIHNFLVNILCTWFYTPKHSCEIWFTNIKMKEHFWTWLHRILFRDFKFFFFFLQKKACAIFSWILFWKCFDSVSQNKMSCGFLLNISLWTFWIHTEFCKGNIFHSVSQEKVCEFFFWNIFENVLLTFSFDFTHRIIHMKFVLNILVIFFPHSFTQKTRLVKCFLKNLFIYLFHILWIFYFLFMLWK